MVDVGVWLFEVECVTNCGSKIVVVVGGCGELALGPGIEYVVWREAGATFTSDLGHL